MKLCIYKRIRAVLAVLLGLLVLLACADGVLLYGALTCDNAARTLPPYPKISLDGILAKDRAEWTDEDYETVSRQTGLFLRETIDGYSAQTLRDFQRGFFFEGELRHHTVVDGVVYHDVLYDPETGGMFSMPIVDPQPGDVLITSTSHTLGWRNGHAALVLTNRQILQSYVIGTKSVINNFQESNALPWFQTSANFIVLRLKREAGESDEDYAARRTEIAVGARKNLVGVVYSLTCGVFTPKDQGEHPVDTYCSHIVWQAFKNCGYDIDGDGGPICTPHGITVSDCFDVVQVYGFDPDKLWQ